MIEYVLLAKFDPIIFVMIVYDSFPIALDEKIYPSYDKYFNYQPKFRRWNGIGSMISLTILQHFLRDNIQEVAMLPHFFILSLQLFIHCTVLKLQLFNHCVNSNPLCKVFPSFLSMYPWFFIHCVTFQIFIPYSKFSYILSSYKFFFIVQTFGSKLPTFHSLCNLPMNDGWKK